MSKLSARAASNKDKRNADNTAVMQHRHYAVVAGIIADLDLDYPQRAIIADQFARKLAANPNFDRARFIKACGIN